MDGVELTELAGACQFGGEDEVADRTPLGAGLKDAGVTADGVGEVEALLDGEGEWFLAIHVLAGLGGEDGGHGVPAVAGGDEEGVDVGPIEDRLEVIVGDAVLRAVEPVDHFLD